MATNTPVLEVRDISKTFGATRALRHVEFSIEPGEVFAVLGQNGSGKSTLVKILSGFHAPDPGAEIVVDGEPLPVPLPPGMAREAGMEFVYQDLGLVPGMTVLENLTIQSRTAGGSRGILGGGGMPRDRGVLRGGGVLRPIAWRRERREARAVLARYGLDLDPAARVAGLPLMDQALLAIARAAEELQAFRARTGKDRSLLVLDEPTVFLTGAELDFLFDLIRIVASSGASVMFISHDLEAVRAVASRFVVLRDGEVAGTGRVADVTEDQMIDMIVGSARERFERSAARTIEAVTGPGLPPATRIREAELLAVEGLAGGAVRELSFGVREGEIVGLAGATGSGPDDVPYLLFGGDGVSGRVPVGGTVTIAGRRHAARRLSSASSIRAGLALVPADRARDAAVASLSVADNILMLVYGRYFSKGVLGRRAMMTDAGARAGTFDIRPPVPSAPLAQMSGGNQQKTVLAKWMEPEPRILLLHEPTQGVDVGARAEIRTLVKDACRERGMGVVWVTTDFAELAEMCDRVLVFADGRVVTQLSGDEVTKPAIDEAVIRTSAGR
ncbi:MAG: sugar ABC transporter ATP-binding protein [Nocardiopsaceae bacterium]|nr:sugar ABC transporter ATP-binding protein [Nocardiopsaceae bacterium]